jgi:retron-type reverse transcriptase
MYENLMEEALREENCEQALKAVMRNKGAAGIDRMPVSELKSHLQTHGEKIKAKLRAGTYVPSPQAGRDTQAKRRDKDAGDPNGDRSVDSAVVIEGADPDFRPAVQQA